MEYELELEDIEISDIYIPNERLVDGVFTVHRKYTRQSDGIPCVELYDENSDIRLTIALDAFSVMFDYVGVDGDLEDEFFDEEYENWAV